MSKQSDLVDEKLHYYFDGIKTKWNVPSDMQFMHEFLNEVEKLIAEVNLSHVQNVILSRIDREIETVQNSDEYSKREKHAIVFYLNRIREAISCQ